MPLLDWVNRNQAEETADNVPYHLLKFEEAYGDKQKAKENLIIQGDNLQALKALLPLYGGQVKCIFIDPPYNTQSAFEHYDDKLEHAQWLSMMYPRLQLLKKLLAQDGSIWITLDDNESHYMKVLCDGIFGRSNFVTDISWQKVYSQRMDAKLFSTDHDSILVYRKSELFTVNKVKVKQNLKQFNSLDEETGLYYRKRSLRKEGSNSRREDRPNLWYGIEAPDGTMVYPIRPSTNTEGNWRWSKETYEQNLQKGLVEFIKKKGEWNIYVKQFVEEDPSRPPSTIWLNNEVGNNHEAKNEAKKFNTNDVFDTPKPEKLLQRIIHIATNEGDIVLDSFLGSGTTTAVAHKMGRKYIGIEMGDHAKTHVIPRLEKVIDGEKGGISTDVEWKGGGGFSFYTLGSSVFDEQGFLHSDVKFSDLASYVWWLETHTAFISTNDITTPFLGVHEGVAYYLLYNGILGDRRPNGGNVLTNPILKYLNECHEYEGKRIIIGEATRIGSAKLETLAIEFKQIPYALYVSQAK
ncbi:site-specific DNA-methyltransferase [Psychrobacter sp. ASPA161_9]|uniref:site-specific DNA-methyltransferase n=1 Tax=Psychrobacter sp. ASPA161_9 TaxID=3160961 RepID=UPI003F7E4E89